LYDLYTVQVALFWVVTQCADVVGYQCFRGLCCLHLHFTLKMEAAWSSKMFVSYITTQCHNTADCNLSHYWENLKSFIGMMLHSNSLLSDDRQEAGRKKTVSWHKTNCPICCTKDCQYNHLSGKCDSI